MKTSCVNPSKKKTCDEEICGHCLHHRRYNEEWICRNPDSENFGGYTEYNDSCKDFENRSS